LLQLVAEVQVSPPLVVEPLVLPLLLPLLDPLLLPFVDPLLLPFVDPLVLPFVVDGIDMSGWDSGTALHQPITCALAATQSSHELHANSLPSAVW
jgi:hypothetical protein